MDKALQDELNVDPWTPPRPDQSTSFTTAAASGPSWKHVAKCPTCSGSLLMAVTRESSVTVAVCEKCRKRVAREVLEAQP